MFIGSADPEVKLYYMKACEVCRLSTFPNELLIYHVAKTKEVISCPVSVQLICAVVLVCTKGRFSHAGVQIISNVIILQINSNLLYIIILGEPKISSVHRIV